MGGVTGGQLGIAPAPAERGCCAGIGTICCCRNVKINDLLVIPRYPN